MSSVAKIEMGKEGGEYREMVERLIFQKSRSVSTYTPCSKKEMLRLLAGPKTRASRIRSSPQHSQIEKPQELYLSFLNNKSVRTSYLRECIQVERAIVSLDTSLRSLLVPTFPLVLNHPSISDH